MTDTHEPDEPETSGITWNDGDDFTYRVDRCVEELSTLVRLAYESDPGATERALALGLFDVHGAVSTISSVIGILLDDTKDLDDDTRRELLKLVRPKSDLLRSVVDGLFATAQSLTAEPGGADSSGPGSG